MACFTSGPLSLPGTTGTCTGRERESRRVPLPGTVRVAGTWYLHLRRENKHPGRVFSQPGCVCVSRSNVMYVVLVLLSEHTLCCLSFFSIDPHYTYSSLSRETTTNSSTNFQLPPTATTPSPILNWTVPGTVYLRY